MNYYILLQVDKEMCLDILPTITVNIISFSFSYILTIYAYRGCITIHFG